jgi:hypothetical protein
LIIDPKEGDVDVIVSIQILRGGAKGHLPADDKKTHVGLARESVVQVRYLPSLGSGAVMLLCDIRDHASMVTRGRDSLPGLDVVTMGPCIQLACAS